MTKKLDLILGILIVIYSISISVIFGKISFNNAILMVGIILVVYHYVKDNLKCYINNFSKGDLIIKLSKYLVAIMLLIFIIIESAIVIYPKSDLSYSDYVIVLGAGVNGVRPSLTLKQRLEATIKYVNNQNREVKVIVSGGQGKGEDISEAEAMKRYLVNSGVNEKLIIMEDKSTTTRENLIFSSDILERESLKNISDIKVKIITSDFHAFRSNMIAKSLNYRGNSFYTNRTAPFLVPVMYCREFLAVIKYYLLNIKDNIHKII